jgi:hypothetical protein
MAEVHGHDHAHEGPCDHPHSAELLRVWHEGENLNLSVFPQAFEDAEAWGIVLATVVRQVAQALHKEGGPPPAETVTRIEQAFVADLHASADDKSG